MTDRGVIAVSASSAVVAVALITGITTGAMHHRSALRDERVACVEAIELSGAITPDLTVACINDPRGIAHINESK